MNRLLKSTIFLFTLLLPVTAMGVITDEDLHRDKDNQDTEVHVKFTRLSDDKIFVKFVNPTNAYYFCEFRWIRSSGDTAPAVGDDGLFVGEMVDKKLVSVKPNQISKVFVVHVNPAPVLNEYEYHCEGIRPVAFDNQEEFEEFRRKNPVLKIPDVVAKQLFDNPTGQSF